MSLENLPWSGDGPPLATVHDAGGIRAATASGIRSASQQSAGSSRPRRGWLSFVLSESRGPRNTLTRLPTILSRFGLSARKSERQLAILLSVAERYGVRPTMPITAMTARRHPRIAQWLAQRGVELAGHGYVHNDYAALTAEEQLDQVKRTKDTLAALGLPIRGWRCPYFRWNEHTVPALRENGFDYDSTTVFAWPVLEEEGIAVAPDAAADYRRLCMLFSARDAREHLVLPTMMDGLVQIPAALPQDEDMVDRLHLDGRAMTHVWVRLLQEVRRREEIFVMNLHPERSSLCAEPLAATLAEARGLSDVWIATLQEIADWWRERDRTRVTVRQEAEGRWDVTVDGPDRLTMTTGTHRSIAARAIQIDAPAKPVIQCSDTWLPAVHQCLRDAGYVSERRTEAGETYLVDLDSLLPPDTPAEAVVRFVQQQDAPLLRIDPWPGGYRACLSLTGDIDAVTLIDFALRLKEFS